MTEAEWESATEPQEMLLALRASGKASERRLRLFACACCRRIWHLVPDERSRHAVEVLELSADGAATEAERVKAHWDSGDAPVTGLASFSATNAVGYATGDGSTPAEDAAKDALEALSRAALDNEAAVRAEAEHQAALIRCIFGPTLFRPRVLPPSVRTWEGGTVVKLAAGVYAERDFTQVRIGVRADAVEEAGLLDAELLGHLRGPGPHARGCHGIDLLLGKE
ncbi:MAG TPA: hypothetical protein VFE78_31160 [Gemmataceae bacterium]|jgi:hypothetical protein|nr:hypothetical protein [Gemmataceae bacterium]